jgi:hypothetical protein
MESITNTSPVDWSTAVPEMNSAVKVGWAAEPKTPRGACSRAAEARVGKRRRAPMVSASSAGKARSEVEVLVAEFGPADEAFAWLFTYLSPCPSSPLPAAP